MNEGIKTYKEWQEFAKGYTQKTIRLTAEDIFSMTPSEKQMRLKDKVLSMFLKEGVEVTRYRHNYGKQSPKEYFGLIFHRTDSDITETIEITALIGVNARYIHGVQAGAN